MIPSAREAGRWRQLTELVYVCAALLMLVCSAPAQAQSCNFSITNMNFGVIDLTANVSFPGTAQVSGSCTGTKGKTVVVCMSIGDGQYGSNSQGSPRLMSNGTSSLSFSFYTSSANTVVWGSYVWPWATAFPGNSANVALSATTGAGSFTATLYGLIYAGQQNLSTGAYSSFFSSPHTYFSYGYSGTGTCAGQTIATGFGRPTFTVSATFPATCSLSATNMNFPSTGALTASVDATSNVLVICSNGTPYVVSLGLGNGAGVTSPSARKMTGAGGSIVYGLYRDSARSLPWGDSAGVDTLNGTGNGGTQTLTVYGRTPVQATPAPGLYSDTIVATVTY